MTNSSTEDDSGGVLAELPSRLTDVVQQLRGASSETATDEATEDELQDDSAAQDEPRQDAKDPAADGSDADDKRELLLTDEERILRELQASGRLRQSELVSRMGWTKVKVSRVLSQMEEADQITRTQIGREKVVALPGQEFEAAKSSIDSDGADSELAYR